MRSPYDSDDIVEIYRTDSPLEVRRLVDVVLRPQGVEAVVHDRVDHALLAPATQPGDFFVAVPRSQRERALILLDEYLAAMRTLERAPD